LLKLNENSKAAGFHLCDEESNYDQQLPGDLNVKMRFFSAATKNAAVAR